MYKSNYTDVHCLESKYLVIIRLFDFDKKFFFFFSLLSFRVKSDLFNERF